MNCIKADPDSDPDSDTDIGSQNPKIFMRHRVRHKRMRGCFENNALRAGGA